MIRTPSFIEGKVQSPLHKIRVKLGPGLASRGSDKSHVAKPLPPTQNPLLNSRSLQRFWQTTFSSHSTGCFAAIRTPPEHPWQKVYIKKAKSVSEELTAFSTVQQYLFKESLQIVIAAGLESIYFGCFSGESFNEIRPQYQPGQDNVTAGRQVGHYLSEEWLLNFELRRAQDILTAYVRSLILNHASTVCREQQIHSFFHHDLLRNIRLREA